jgi:hypothetical protein
MKQLPTMLEESIRDRLSCFFQFQKLLCQVCWKQWPNPSFYLQMPPIVENHLSLTIFGIQYQQTQIATTEKKIKNIKI